MFSTANYLKPIDKLMTGAINQTTQKYKGDGDVRFCIVDQEGKVLCNKNGVGRIFIKIIDGKEQPLLYKDLKKAFENQSYGTFVKEFDVVTRTVKA